MKFIHETEIKLSKVSLENAKVCAVDLGITNSAVCSILDAKGTVLARKFIIFRQKDSIFKK